MKKIDIGQNAKVVIRWDTKQALITEEDEKKMIAVMAKKYGIPEKNIKIEKNFISEGEDSTMAGDIVNNIYDPKFMQELMKRWLIEKYGEEEAKKINFDEIVKIDSQINSSIDFDLYNNGKRYNINWIRWGNFLSYGPDNYFDFTTLHGLVLLNGEPANKSGKSTFAYDLIHFLLFGKTNTAKAKTLGDLFNNYLPEERTLKVEGCITIDGENYIIRRTLTRPAAGKKTRTVTNKVEYFKLLKDGTEEELVDENQQGATTTATSKIIKDAIGNESDFDLIISANARDLANLISLTETERGRLLSRWIGLLVIEDKDAKAREKWNKEITVGRYCDMYSQAQLQNEIEELENHDKELRNSITEAKGVIEDAEKKITEQQGIRDTLLSSKIKVDENLLKIDVTTLQTALERLKVSGQQTNQKIEAAKGDLANIGDVDFSEEEYKKLDSENRGLISKMAEARTEIRHLTTENTNLASAEFCPTCHRKFDNVDNSGIIEGNKKKIKALTDSGIEMKKRSEEIAAQISALEAKRSNKYKKSQIELKIATLNSELNSQRNEYREKNTTLQEIQKNKDAIATNSKIDADINVIDVNIRSEETRKRNNNSAISLWEREIAKDEELVKQKRGYIVKIEEERNTEKYWKLYLQMIGKDGIGKMVLRNTLPIINSELDNLLGDVSDFKVEVIMNEKNDVDFILKRDGIVTRLSGASGLEQTQAALALRVVLGKMSNLSRPPFILLDEVLGTVAKENYDDMKRLYDKIVKEYQFILHITHLADIADWHENIITVQKINNISKIK